MEKGLAFIPVLPGTDLEISDGFMGRDGHLHPSCGYSGEMIPHGDGVTSQNLL